MLRKYSHIVVIGVDGAGSWFKDADTPFFDKIFKNGAVTYKALSSKPTISAECWGSMLIGVGPEVHKLTNNRVSVFPYPIWSKHPTIFRRIRKAFPEAELGSYCDWNPINKGIVEKKQGVDKQTAKDKELTPIICKYIREKKPDFLFVHFDSVDGAGHSNGYGTVEHIRAISEADKLIGDVYSAIEGAGMVENTLFIVVADHGGTNGENGKGSHGGWTDEEKYVTFAAVGKDIKNGEIREMNIRDLAAIVLYAMGIEAPVFDEKGWTSQIPEGLFNDYDGEYCDISHLTGAAPRISKKHHKSELV
ncbi:MAG: alkaline phosphatase family protein [Acutalibacteraceae bacterium]|nr:alkaline phosphatase family protein [Acutalibacteraceae bacterium]